MNWFRRTFAPNRLVVYLTAIGGAATAATIYLEAQPTPETTTALLVSYGGAALMALKWLDGWQKAEARGDAGTTPGRPPVETPTPAETAEADPAGGDLGDAIGPGMDYTPPVEGDQGIISGGA